MKFLSQRELNVRFAKANYVQHIISWKNIQTNPRRTLKRRREAHKGPRIDGPSYS